LVKSDTEGQWNAGTVGGRWNIDEKAEGGAGLNETLLYKLALAKTDHVAACRLPAPATLLQQLTPQLIHSMKLKLGGLFKHATSCGIGRDSTHDHNTPLVRPTQGIPQIKLRSQGPGPKTLTDIKLYRFNLAICGGHKAGKTALINALLHAKHGAAGEGAARVFWACAC
jgi:hypothetical protein